MRKAVRGFTLIEATIAMAVGAILLGTAVPALTGAVSSAHAAATEAELLESMTLSISHAALAGSEVVLCPGQQAGCRNTSDWSGGWVAYADIDGDRQRDANETLLFSTPGLAGGVHLHSTGGRTRLVFQPNGGNAGSNVTFTLCDARGPAMATTLVLANDGRLRSGKPTVGAALACLQPI